MKKIDAPCYGCPDRYLGCHDTCEKYKEFKNLRNEINEKRYKEQSTICRPYIMRYKNPWRM